MSLKLQTLCRLITVLLALGFGTPAKAVFLPDTLKPGEPDTLVLKPDTLPVLSKKPFRLDGEIIYSASDSTTFSIDKKLAFLQGNAYIEYKDLKLKAGTIRIDFNRNILYAKYITDSTGKKTGIPDFTQGNTNFKSDEISYNFNTRKGFIRNVITKEGEGYLHAYAIKKLSDTENAAKGGMYTTCNLDDPHFAINFNKAKVITGDKIVTGPAYMNIEGVPLPLALPFGLFPNKRGRSSGIVFPRYGESANRGFYLEEGGYYFGLNDYFDLKLTGDIYSHGSWAVKPTTTYRKRYKFSGNFSIKYAVNILGYKDSPDYSRNKDFFVTWSHRQDPKARPKSTFSASVQAGSSRYNTYNPSSVNDYLNNSFSSSISYDLRISPNANLTASARHSQNTTTRQVTVTLPEVAFGFNRFYPFKRKIQTGKARWYESISVTYNMNARNEISTVDSMLFRPEAIKDFINGVQHKIPVSGSFKLLKYITGSASINYSERWYSKSIHKTYVEENDLTYRVEVDTINRFRAVRDYNFSSSLSTTLYGMLKFRKGPVKAIRHVLRPSVGFSYLPEFGKESLGYYQTVQVNPQGKTEKYPVFGSGFGLYGYPSMNESGSVNFSLGNNLEMKVRSNKDTITGYTKVMLIDNLSVSTSYDLAKDSMRWSNVNVNGRTTLFKKIQVNYSSLWSPYALNANGVPYNKYELTQEGKLLRFSNTSWNLSVGYDFSSAKSKKKKTSAAPQPTHTTSPAEMQELEENPDRFIDWNNPWNFRFDYNFRYFSQPDLVKGGKKRDLVQTLRAQGELNVTENWRVSLQTGYDFDQKKFAFTQMSIYRNLHCWEMRFNWIPYGYQKSWNFQLNVKSSLLQDLKLTKKKDFRDNL